MKQTSTGGISGLALFLILIFLIPQAIFAQSSTHYQMQKSVLDMSGKVSESPNYVLLDAMGQLTPPGRLFSTHYILGGGFLAQALNIEFWGVKLTAGDGDSADAFGRALAIAGDDLFIGASDDDNEKGRDAGSVYLFTRSGQTWNEVRKLLAKDGS